MAGNVWKQVFKKIDEERDLVKKRYYQNSNNLGLRLPEGMYTFGAGECGYGEVFEVMKTVCELSQLRFDHLIGRGPQTGRGYGDLHCYIAENPNDKSLIAEIKLHSLEYFTDTSRIGMYSPLLSDQEIEKIRESRDFPKLFFIEPNAPSIASIDDKVLRLFISEFYEVLNRRRK